ncbi:MAG: hypothetical protein AAFY60_11395 [Myxococcota bacterium]
MGLGEVAMLFAATGASVGIAAAELLVVREHRNDSTKFKAAVADLGQLMRRETRQIALAD